MIRAPDIPEADDLAAFQVVGVEWGWNSSAPGVPLEALVQSRTANPVILVDEIYKSGSRWSGNARVETLTTTLLGLLEPETTRSWECCHTQLRFDMSRICWILTSNDAKAIPAPLKDCCRVLSMRSPVLGRSGGPSATWSAEAAWPGQAVQVDTLTVSLRPGRTVRHFTAVDRLSRWGCGMAASNATAASAARFLDKLVRQAPFSVEAVQVDGGSEFMAEFEAACGDRNITLAVLPPKSPKQNGRVERMQATLRNEFYNVQDTAVNVSGLRPLIDEYMELYNGWRPHDSLDGMTPDEYLESRRIGETPPLHMS